VSGPGITLQKSIDCGFLNLLQAKLRDWSHLLNLAIAYICIGTDDGKKPSCSNTFQISIKMRGQWPDAKPAEKTGVNKSLQIPRMAIPGHSRLYAESFTVACLLDMPPPSAFGIVRNSA
jgi:hypothetical protein